MKECQDLWANRTFKENGRKFVLLLSILENTVLNIQLLFSLLYYKVCARAIFSFEIESLI